MVYEGKSTVDVTIEGVGVTDASTLVKEFPLTNLKQLNLNYMGERLAELLFVFSDGRVEKLTFTVAD